MSNYRTWRSSLFGGWILCLSSALLALPWAYGSSPPATKFFLARPDHG